MNHIKELDRWRDQGDREHKNPQSTITYKLNTTTIG
jgi:hypothetical protein